MVKCSKCGNPDIWDDTRKPCEYCRYLRMIDANKQMREKKGPVYEKWKKALRGAVK